MVRRLISIKARDDEPHKHRGRVPATEDARARRQLAPDLPADARGPLRMSARPHPRTRRLHLVFYCPLGHVLTSTVVGAHALDTDLGRLWVDLWAAWHHVDDNPCKVCVREGAGKMDLQPRQNPVR